MPVYALKQLQPILHGMSKASGTYDHVWKHQPIINFGTELVTSGCWVQSQVWTVFCTGSSFGYSTGSLHELKDIAGANEHPRALVSLWDAEVAQTVEAFARERSFELQLSLVDTEFSYSVPARLQNGEFVLQSSPSQGVLKAAAAPAVGPRKHYPLRELQPILQIMHEIPLAFLPVWRYRPIINFAVRKSGCLWLVLTVECTFPTFGYSPHPLYKLKDAEGADACPNVIVYLEDEEVARMVGDLARDHGSLASLYAQHNKPVADNEFDFCQRFNDTCLV